MKRRAVRRTRSRRTKTIMRGSKILVVWEYGVRHRHAGTKGMTIIAKALMAFWCRINVLQEREQPWSMAEPTVGVVNAMSSKTVTVMVYDQEESLRPGGKCP